MQMRKILFPIFLVGALFYGFFTARDIVFPPKIQIISPQNFSSLHSTKVKVSGFTSPSTSLWIDGRVTQSDELGFFEEVLYVYPGYNEIGIRVQNKFGRESKKILKLAVE